MFAELDPARAAGCDQRLRRSLSCRPVPLPLPLSRSAAVLVSNTFETETPQCSDHVARAPGAYQLEFFSERGPYRERSVLQHGCPCCAALQTRSVFASQGAHRADVDALSAVDAGNLSQRLINAEPTIVLNPLSLVSMTPTAARSCTYSRVCRVRTCWGLLYRR